MNKPKKITVVGIGHDPLFVLWDPKKEITKESFDEFGSEHGVRPTFFSSITMPDDIAAFFDQIEGKPYKKMKQQEVADLLRSALCVGWSMKGQMMLKNN